jgi:5-methyltetrahydrofolate--homocysteine methyltransferase
VVGDGAWGTQLIERGLEPGGCPELFGVRNPGILREIASAYLDSGAEYLTTNTFGGSPLKLRPYGLEEATEEINESSVRILRETAAGRAWVCGSIGPSGAILEPYGDAEEGEVLASFERQARALVSAQVDLICVETMMDLREARLALTAVRAVSPATPVMATMTFDSTPRGFFTVMGTSIEQAAAGLAEAGADVIGSNCGHGIGPMVEIAREFRGHTTMPTVIQPNAGVPENRAGRPVFPESPSFFAANMQAVMDTGISVLGGCCGTTPEHVRALREFVKSSKRGGGR